MKDGWDEVLGVGGLGDDSRCLCTAKCFFGDTCSLGQELNNIQHFPPLSDYFYPFTSSDLPTVIQLEISADKST